MIMSFTSYKYLITTLYNKYIVLSIIGLIALSSTANAQNYKNMMHDNSVNFYDAVNEAEKHFKTHKKGKRTDEER